MSARRCVVVAMTLLAASLAVACAASTAPRGWLPGPGEAQAEAYGGWISVQRQSHRETIHGELIAVDRDSVFVLTAEELFVIPLADVRRAKLTSYKSGGSAIALWGLAGTLSTISHGVILIISAPLWIVSSSIAAAGASREPQVTYPQRSQQELSMYARFPQGLPEGLDRSLLTLKPRR